MIFTCSTRYCLRDFSLLLGSIIRLSIGRMWPIDGQLGLLAGWPSRTIKQNLNRQQEGNLLVKQSLYGRLADLSATQQQSPIDGFLNWPHDTQSDSRHLLIWFDLRDLFFLISFPLVLLTRPENGWESSWLLWLTNYSPVGSLWQLNGQDQVESDRLENVAFHQTLATVSFKTCLLLLTNEIGSLFSLLPSTSSSSSRTQYPSYYSCPFSLSRLRPGRQY